MIGQPCRSLGDAMGQLMPDDVQGAGESLEDDAVSVAEDHFRTIPKGVIEFLAVMHIADQGHALAVDRVAVKDFRVELIGIAKPIVRLVGGGISAGRAAFSSYYVA